MFNVIYQWLIVWVNVLAYKLDSLTETIWGYCDEGCKHAQISVGSLWITLSGWHESQCQRLTTKDARSQLSMQKAMQGDKGSWEVAIGGVGCRAVDGWTREKGASRCLKPLTVTKTADPRTGTDSEELRGALHWSQKSSPQQARPTDSFMRPGNRKCKRYFFPHTVL